MDIFISALLGDLTTRSINFIIRKFSTPMLLDVEDHLRRVLLRAQVIINEAMDRHITNQAMLFKLDILRDTMLRGYYVLDTFRYQRHNEAAAKDQNVSHSSFMSKVNSAKHLCFSSRGTQALKEMRETLDDLSYMILDVNDLVMFLMCCPRLYRQPYSMHLQLANCMFARQMEAQFVINFLLQTQPHCAGELEVLPIVGPCQAGKSTLVAHVCKDGRVRDRFSEIMFFSIYRFTDDELSTFRKGCVTKIQKHMSHSNKDGRLLVVVELDGDLNEEALNRLYSASKQYAPRGSKVIVTSRFDNIVKFGTTEALTLKRLSDEAYWYFFKTLTFGSMDPEMHPRLRHLAMEIGRTKRSSLNSANIVSRLLRDNFDTKFWSKVLAFWKGSIQQRICRIGEHPFDLLYQNKRADLGRMVVPSEAVAVYHLQQRSSEEEVPNISMQDVIYKGIKPHGKVEVLLWKSRIPPYCSYVYTCEIRELKSTGAKRKRCSESGTTLC